MYFLSILKHFSLKVKYFLHKNKFHIDFNDIFCISMFIYSRCQEKSGCYRMNANESHSFYQFYRIVKEILL